MVAVALIAAVLAPAITAGAQAYDPREDLQRPSGLERRLTKLGRGIANVLFGWAEIPVTMDEKLREEKPLSYLVGVAPVLGTARALMRTGTGVFEVVTFPFSDEEVNFEALLEPEYIF
jgi:putative exosortase-associated protein (TIGR04073 family)